MFRRKRVFVGVLLVATVLALPIVSVYKVAQFLLAGPDSPRPAPTLFASSDSPDGHYRCEIWEQTPAFGMYSPYTYDLTIVDRKTGKPIPGSPGGAFGDSCAMCPNPCFEWTDQDLRILEENGNRYFVRFDNGEQVWGQPAATQTVTAN